MVALTTLSAAFIWMKHECLLFFQSVEKQFWSITTRYKNLAIRFRYKEDLSMFVYLHISLHHAQSTMLLNLGFLLSDLSDVHLSVSVVLEENT